MQSQFVEFVRDTYQADGFVPLHEPVFSSKEKQYVVDAIDSTFVSSVGEYVNKFESQIENYTNASKAVATVNGTAALHAALHVAGVQRGDMVITQALTFVATCNALLAMGAEPIFVDVSKISLGLCPVSLAEYLDRHAVIDDDGFCLHRKTRKKIRAVVPMHTFGHPVELDELVAVCAKWNLPLIEDAAESLGSFYKNRHTGTFGEMSALSFNGNKVITTGGGGMVLCQESSLGDRVKHITTTAKVPHPYEFFHDEQGFNYRMPNLNAALGCAQLEALPVLLEKKRKLAEKYQEFFDDTDYFFFEEPEYARSNYWLNAIICPDRETRDNFLKETNKKGIMTRPVWQLMHRLPMFKTSCRTDLVVSEWLESHLINLPSTPAIGDANE